MDLTRTPLDEWPKHRVSSGNIVEPLIDASEYLERWHREAAALRSAGDAAVLLHAGWRIHNVAAHGRLDEGPGAYATFADLREAGVRTYVRLSGHAFGLANTAALRRLRHRATVLDRTMPWHASNHEKLTVFSQPGSTRALLGSIDHSKTRWDTREHHPLDTARYLRDRPTHDVGVAVDGPAAVDLGHLYLARHRGFRQNGRRFEACPVLPEGVRRPGGTGSHVQVLATIPYREAPTFPAIERSLGAAYCNAISKAKRYIYIEDQYFWPFFTFGSGIARADQPNPLAMLVAAVERGVDIVVMMPVPRGGPVGKLQARRRHAALRALRNAQRRGSGRVLLASLCRDTTRVYVHSKILIVDDEYCIVGSANLNRRGFLSDFEIGVGVADAAVAREFRVSLWSEHLEMPVSALMSPQEAVAEFVAALASSHRNLRRYRVGDSRGVGTRAERAVWDALIDPDRR